MCGLVACVHLGDGNGWDAEDVEKKISDALGTITHRGPDSSGLWTESKRCALGHCRLSINDLSPSGSQPLHSADGTLHAIVNGEIYDHDQLRSSLPYTFAGHSDSELVLALYEAHGLEFLSYLRGEFALVLYDERSDRVIAARDRYGIKPLFWRRDGEQIWFGAEIKTFLGTGWKPEWDVESIASGGWGQDTRTIFKGVNKLRPGQYMICEKGREPEFKQYWDISYPPKDKTESRSEEEMISSLRTHLIDAVRLRLKADVPVGIYLSGGIDSSALAGIANYLVRHEGISMGSNNANEAICCFSIAFDAESGFDESDIAQRTADHLGVKYLKTHMDETALANAFEEATYHIEHHSHDLNYIGKFVLSSLPRKHGYKVVLTGEGADEQFGGYPLFLPDFVRGEGDNGDDLETMVKQSYDKIGANTSFFDGPCPLPLVTPSAMSAFTPTSLIQTNALSPLETITQNIPDDIKRQIQDEWHPLHGAQYVWQKGHLANQFLSCLGDRVEMAHSIEARPPFLDHKLTEFVNSLPPSIKIRQTIVDGKTKFVEKYAMREAVKPFVTEEVYSRTKHAYTAPTTYPAAGPIHRLLLRLVTQENVDRLGFIAWTSVETLIRSAFQEGDEENPGRIWAWRQIVMIAQWVVLSQKFGVLKAEP